jgi:hypothetical protein
MFQGLIVQEWQQQYRSSNVRHGQTSAAGCSQLASALLLTHIVAVQNALGIKIQQ